MFYNTNSLKWPNETGKGLVRNLIWYEIQGLNFTFNLSDSKALRLLFKEEVLFQIEIHTMNRNKISRD